MKLHGHTKIELTDVNTGAVETVEKDNLITNAVSELLNGFGGITDVRSWINYGLSGVTGLTAKDLVTALYGGLLLHDTALGSDPDTLFTPGDVNIVGAGIPNRVNSGDNTIEGSFNVTESDIAPEKGYVTYVYDFATSQGNGTIASVSLTSAMGGFFSESANRFTINEARTFQPMPLGNTPVALPKYTSLCSFLPSSNSTTRSYMPLYADTDKDYAVFARILFSGVDNAPVLRLQYRSLNLHSLDLFQTKADGGWNNLLETKDLPIADIVQQKTANTDGYNVTADVEAGKFYIVSVPAQVLTTATIKVREYDMDTLESKDYTLPNNSGVRLSSYLAQDDCKFFPGTVYEGWLYLYGYDYQDGTQPLYRIWLQDATKVECIKPSTAQGLVGREVADCHDGRVYLPVYTTPGSGVSLSRDVAVLNTHTKQLKFINFYKDEFAHNTYRYAVPTRGSKIGRLYYAAGSSPSPWRWFRGYRPNYLATINDLDTPVEKTADKTMKITYTLRREE